MDAFYRDYPPTNFAPSPVFFDVHMQPVVEVDQVQLQDIECKFPHVLEFPVHLIDQFLLLSHRDAKNQNTQQTLLLISQDYFESISDPIQ